MAIIPARGNSKRLARKNILLLDGIPLLAHVINNALATGLFDKVIVSTEDKEIKDIALDYGAQVHNRNYSLSEDNVSVNQVCEHVLPDCNWLGPSKLFCVMYSTAVLLRPETLTESLSSMDEECDYVMGVSHFNYPPVQALKSSVDGYLSYQWPEFKGIRSQLHPDLVVSNGSFYWARSNAFMQEKTIYGKRLKGFVVPDEQVCDLDYAEDFERLKIQYYRLNLK